VKELDSKRVEWSRFSESVGLLLTSPRKEASHG
jgi:hypothetical protein